MSASSEKKTAYSFVLGFVAFVVIFIIVLALWQLFMDANGILKLYTPMYRFSLVAVWLTSIIMISKVFEFYPFSETNDRQRWDNSRPFPYNNINLPHVDHYIRHILEPHWKVWSCVFQSVLNRHFRRFRSGTFCSERKRFHSHNLFCDGVHMVGACLGPWIR